jgi:hypothetical protein
MAEFKRISEIEQACFERSWPTYPAPTNYRYSGTHKG